MQSNQLLTYPTAALPPQAPLNQNSLLRPLDWSLSSNFFRWNIFGSNLIGLNFLGSNFTGSDFFDSKIFGSNFLWSNFFSWKFFSSNLSNLNFILHWNIFRWEFSVVYILILSIWCLLKFKTLWHWFASIHVLYKNFQTFYSNLYIFFQNSFTHVTQHKK